MNPHISARQRGERRSQHRFRRLLPLAILSSCLVCAGSTLADIIAIPPGNVTASSEITTCCSDRDPADIVNASGLVGGLHDVTPGNMWLSTGTAFGGDDLDPFVIFDLGAVYTIRSFHVWNYNEAGTLAMRGVNSVSVEYGTTAALGSTVAGITNFAKATGANA